MKLSTTLKFNFNSSIALLNLIPFDFQIKQKWFLSIKNAKFFSVVFLGLFLTRQINLNNSYVFYKMVEVYHVSLHLIFVLQVEKKHKTFLYILHRLKINFFFINNYRLCQYNKYDLEIIVSS